MVRSLYRLLPLLILIVLTSCSTFRHGKIRFVKTEKEEPTDSQEIALETTPESITVAPTALMIESNDEELAQSSNVSPDSQPMETLAMKESKDNFEREWVLNQYRRLLPKTEDQHRSSTSRIGGFDGFGIFLLILGGILFIGGIIATITIIVLASMGTTTWLWLIVTIASIGAGIGLIAWGFSEYNPI